eukprot:EC716622.1.p1 GENE.EC716622.1~~EC716622.1.p1  ORF type:complete len:211 (+),score=42.81 EC716622.1:3-635(+)
MADVGAKVDVLINNAGVVSGKNLLDISDRAINLTFGVNVISHFWTVRAFLPAMLQANSGHIVTIASIAGVTGINQMTDYCASKFAAIGFHDSLRAELAVAKSAVRTTVVCPYFINTGMFDGCRTRLRWLLHILEPDYVARRIVHAVRTDEERVLTPRILWVVPIMRALLPKWVEFPISKLLGVHSAMAKFHGRSVDSPASSTTVRRTKAE